MAGSHAINLRPGAVERVGLEITVHALDMGA